MNPNTGTVDDRRAAATIATSLSGYVMAGALAIIGAEAAIFVFLLDGKEMSLWLVLALLLTFAVLFFSCYLGALGIWTIYSDGFGGKWETEVGNKFAWQLVLAVLGILLLFGTSFLANSAKEKPKHAAADSDSQHLSERLAAVDSLPEMDKRLGRIERELDDLNARCSEKCPATDSGSSNSHRADPRGKDKPPVDQPPMEK